MCPVAGLMADSVKLTMQGVGLPPIRDDETDEQYLDRVRAEDDAAMQQEMLDEESLMARAQEELAARQAAEAAAVVQQKIELAQQKIREASERDHYLKRLHYLSQNLTGANELKEWLASDPNRKLYKEGLLSKSNEEHKREKLAQNIGHSYYMLFSDTLLFLHRKTKGGKESFKLEASISMDELKMVQITSHAFDADTNERRGISLAPLDFDRSSITHREHPHRVYAASVEEAKAWAWAFKQVNSLPDDAPRATAVGAHC